MKTIAIANQKGGVGKTTSTATIASILATRGGRVLAVDFDPQGNLSLMCGVSLDGRPSIVDVLKGDEDIRDVIVSGAPFTLDPEGGRRSQGRFDVLPAEITLAGYELKFVTEPGCDFRLKNALDEVAGDYDFCIVDCPPSLGIFIRMAFTAADFVLVPTEASMLAMKGITQLSLTVEMIRNPLYRLNPGLKVLGVFFTKYHSNFVNSRVISDVAGRLADAYGWPTLKTGVHEAVVMQRASNEGQTIDFLDPFSKPAVDYAELVDEIEGLMSGEED